MAKQTINIGASPNDGTGTPLRTAFDYTNQNFTELYTALGGGVGLPGATTQVIFNDGGTNLAGDAGLVYNKTTDALTVAGLVTAGSATITGDLTVDTSTLKVDSANNYVGIGTTSPAQKLHADNQANSCFIRATSTQNSAGFDFGVGGTGDATAYINNRNNTPIAFAINNTEAMRLNTTGNLAFVTGKGIDFSATSEGSGTMTSELLNDYEEGTWTIGLTFGGASTGITANASVGRYTKIGRQVTVSGLLSLTSKGSSTGIAEITGLPFTIANANEAYSVANVRFNGVSFADVPICIGATNSTKISLQEITNAGAVTDITDADFTNTSSCMISFTYTV